MFPWTPQYDSALIYSVTHERWPWLVRLQKHRVVSLLMGSAAKVVSGGLKDLEDKNNSTEMGRGISPAPHRELEPSHPDTQQVVEGTGSKTWVGWGAF